MRTLVLLWAALLVASAYGAGTAPPDRAGPGGKIQYLLVTNNALADAFRPLVERRTRQGRTGKIVTVETIAARYPGEDLQAKIRNCIRDYYRTYGTLWVALGGDQTVIPVRGCVSRNIPAPDPVNFPPMPTDLYYFDMDGGTWDKNHNGVYGEPADIGVEELTPEVYGGRIPVTTPREAADYIRKVIRYESASAEGFARRMLFFCPDGPRGIGGLTGLARAPDYSHHDPVGGADHGYTSWYWNKIQPYWQAMPYHILFGSHTSWDEKEWGDYGMTAEHLRTRLNEGYHFITFSGHATCGGWILQDSVFTNADAMALTNAVPFIVHSGGCEPAAFDYPGDCLAEALLKNPNGGAVAFFGHVRTTGGPGNHHDAFFELMFKNGWRKTGEAVTRLKQSIAKECVADPYGQYNYTLLGDPAIDMHWDIKGRHLQIFMPDGFEVYDPAGTIYMRWNAAGNGFVAGERVKLEYSGDSGQTWQAIPGAQELPYNARIFEWKDPAVAEGDRYRCRVVSLTDPRVCYVSRKDFTIHKLGLLTVRSVGETSIWVGGSHPQRTDCTHTVKIGDTVTLEAPLPDNGVFHRWADESSKLLSYDRTYKFVFSGPTTAVAEYGGEEIELRSRHRRYREAVGDEKKRAGLELVDMLFATANDRLESGLIADAHAYYRWAGDLAATLASKRREEIANAIRLMDSGKENEILAGTGGTPDPAVTLELAKEVAMKLVLIPAGTFRMGSPDTEAAHTVYEGPVHEVTLTRPFYMGVTEVTQEQFEALMGFNPSNSKGARRPVENVTWLEAADFCRRVSWRVGRKVRLPTEAEWEYACRAGSQTAYWFGNNENDLARYARCVAGTNGVKQGTAPVASYPANPWGLYDMHGNVTEFCQDWYDGPYNGDAPVRDPSGPTSGKSRVVRSGSYADALLALRSAFRFHYPPDGRNPTLGFRIRMQVSSRTLLTGNPGTRGAK